MTVLPPDSLSLGAGWRRDSSDRRINAGIHGRHRVHAWRAVYWDSASDVERNYQVADLPTNELSG